MQSLESSTGDKMPDYSEMPCDNIFCIHHTSHNCSCVSDWNKTNCTLFEVDPYSFVDNPNGIRIDNCKARLKYKNMGW